MKICLKHGETVRIETDGDAAVMVYVEAGIVQVTARAIDDTESSVVMAPAVSSVRELAS